MAEGLGSNKGRLRTKDYQMTEVVSVVISYCVTAIVVVLLSVTLLKIVWNIGLPYAMLREIEGRNWSIFPLIELVPFIIALLLAWVVGLGGILSPKVIGSVGAIAIFGSYIHLFLVLFLYGAVVHGVFGKRDGQQSARQKTLPK